MQQKNKIQRAAILILLCLFLICLGYIIYSEFFEESSIISFVQNKEEVYNMECGIIKNCEKFRITENTTIIYKFNEDNYSVLKEKYDIEKIAGDGTEFEKALNLMNTISQRLAHNGNFTEYNKEMNAVELLDYALDKPQNGIFCRAKAQIFNEMFLALNIYSRKLWINPLSIYDSECHVVNEIWDNVYNKWIMLDTTNNLYWIDENGLPLSALEVREKFAEQDFVTPIMPDDNTSDLNKLHDKYESFILYTAKNMVFFRYFMEYGEGEADVIYSLVPEYMEPWDDCLISESTIRESPFR